MWFGNAYVCFPLRIVLVNYWMYIAEDSAIVNTARNAMYVKFRG